MPATIAVALTWVPHTFVTQEYINTFKYSCDSRESQGGLTWLWLDAPYVITARKLFNWAVEANNKVGLVDCTNTVVFPTAWLCCLEAGLLHPVGDARGC